MQLADEQNVLAIDTATPTPAVALFANASLFEEPLTPGRRASEELLPAIRRCLARAGRSLPDLSRIAVCAGPGSFTGVRVGLATAWGLARAASVPVEAVSTLEAIAETARSTGAPSVWVALDAGRGEVALQRFRLDVDRAESEGPATLVPCERVREHAVGAPVIAEPDGILPNLGVRTDTTPARALAEAVVRRPRAAEGGTLRAVYARPSAAEERHGAA